MLRRFTLGAIALGLVACTDLPPPPGVGTGGAGGDGACSSIVMASTEDNEEGTDGVAGETAIGTVSEGSDPIDRWSVNTCGGRHDILLTWDDMGQGFRLDLVLLDSDEQPIDVETTQEETGWKELTGVDLLTGEQFFVEIQAVNTSGVSSLSYNLTVTPLD